MIKNEDDKINLKNDECNDNQNVKKNEKYFKDFQCVAGSVLHNNSWYWK